MDCHVLLGLTQRGVLQHSLDLIENLDLMLAPMIVL
jgi:hypothetical protein